MKWIVIEENPKPDDYIAVVIADDERYMRLQGKAVSIFRNGEEAMKRARLLRSSYGAKVIRIFQWEGQSQR